MSAIITICCLVCIVEVTVEKLGIHFMIFQPESD